MNENSVINSDVIIEKANEYAETRLDIIDEFSVNLKSLKNDFIDTLMPDNVTKDEKKALKREFSKAFGKLKDYEFYKGGYPLPDSKGKVEKMVGELAFALKWLTLIESDVLTENLEKFGLKLTIENNTDENSINGVDEQSVEKIKQIIQKATHNQKSICESVDKIKLIGFEELPAEVRYSKNNKQGIKASQFDKITTIAALQMKDESKAAQKTESMNDSLSNSLITTNVIIEAINKIVQ